MSTPRARPRAARPADTAGRRSREEAPGGRARRLAALQRAHAADRGEHSPRVEDYVEVVFELIEEKGYARIVDVGHHLSVGAPTVTKTLQRLDEEGLVVYERYRGVVLTAAGERLARDIRHRHDVVAAFLRLMGLDEATVHRDTEGLEHHLAPETLGRLADLVKKANEDPAWWRAFAERTKDKGQGTKT